MIFYLNLIHLSHPILFKVYHLRQLLSHACLALIGRTIRSIVLGTPMNLLGQRTNLQDADPERDQDKYWKTAYIMGWELCGRGTITVLIDT